MEPAVPTATKFPVPGVVWEEDAIAKAETAAEKGLEETVHVTPLSLELPVCEKAPMILKTPKL
jgi:hypothetical protein